jgi:hypothetical protein
MSSTFNTVVVTYFYSGLRGLEVTFPPHDPRDAGSNPAEVVEFLRTEKFWERSPPGGALSRLTRVVDLLEFGTTISTLDRKGLFVRKPLFSERWR